MGRGIQVIFLQSQATHPFTDLTVVSGNSYTVFTWVNCTPSHLYAFTFMQVKKNVQLNLAILYSPPTQGQGQLQLIFDHVRFWRLKRTSFCTRVIIWKSCWICKEPLPPPPQNFITGAYGNFLNAACKRPVVECLPEDCCPSTGAAEEEGLRAAGVQVCPSERPPLGRRAAKEEEGGMRGWRGV